MIKKKDVFFSASAITFNLFICAIPFILLMISIIGYVLSYEEAFAEIVRYGQELFPSFTYESESGDVYRGAITLESLLNPLVGARQIFGIIGTVILIFFSLGFFHSLKHVIFDIFEIEDRRHPILEMVYNFFTFGLVGGVFLFFSLAISLLSIFSFDQISLPYTEMVFQLSWIYDLLNLIIPIIFKDSGEVLEACENVMALLEGAGIRVKMDASEGRPGAKYYKWEMKGVPVRLELGPRDLKNNAAMLARRDTGEKSQFSLDNIKDEVLSLLDAVQDGLYNKAKDELEARIFDCSDLDDVKEKTSNGIARVFWCGDKGCGLKLEGEIGAGILGIPTEQNNSFGKCPVCGADSDTQVYVARTY